MFLKKITEECYVSNSGNDSYMGTIDKPVKTIKRALSLNPKKIYLRKGDTFYESFGELKNIEITSYGYGNKPIVSGLIIIDKPEKSFGNDIYIYNIDSSSIGFKCFEKHHYNIGAFFNKSRRCFNLKELREKCDFWQDFDSPKYIYVKSYNRPAHISVGEFAIQRMENSSVNGIKFEYWGRHCISAKSNVSITNCEFSYIGGSVQENYKVANVQYGNGIEFWVNSEISNAEVINCIFDNIYDSSITIQGNTGYSATNILFRGNIIKNQCTAIENFSEGKGYFINCVYENNICINSSPEFHNWRHSNISDRAIRSGHISKGLEDNKEFSPNMPLLINNIFIGGDWYWGGYQNNCTFQNCFNNNIVYIQRGDNIFKKRTNKDYILKVPLDPKEDEKVLALYQEETSDYDTKFIFLDSEELQKILYLYEKCVYINK